jgi:hypothetical protein
MAQACAGSIKSTKELRSGKMIQSCHTAAGSDLVQCKQRSAFGKAVCFIVLTFVFLSCASRHHEPFTVTPPEQRNLSTYENRLQKAAAVSNHLNMEKIGQVDYPDFQAAVWRIHFHAAQSPQYRVLISAAIHGNEPASAEMAARFVEELSESPEKYKDAAIDIVPIVNPWGWVHDIRYNQAGIDINRDFATFNAREANIIKQLLQGTSYDLMVDLHEDPTAQGFYLYQYGLDDKSVCEKIVATIKDMGYPIEEDVRMVILKTENGIIDAPMWGLWYMRLTGQLSIANYYRLNSSRFVYTLETPKSLLWEDRLKMQKTAVTMLLEQFTADK